MPSSGIHGMAGLLAALAIDNEYGKLGAVLGAVIPDIDILVASIYYLKSRDVNVSKKIHRTYTHSLVVHASIACIAGILFAFSSNLAMFLMAFAMMMAVHTLMDYAYICFLSQADAKNSYEAGVSLFAPFSKKKFGLFSKVFSDKAYKSILTADALGDPLVFHAPLLYFSWLHQTDQSFFYPFTILSILFFCILIIFQILAIFGKSSTDRFTVQVYYFAIFCLTLTIIYPLFFVKTIQQI